MAASAALPLAQTPHGKTAEPPAYGARDDVMRFADELAARHHELDARWLRAQLQRARFVGAVQKLIMPPPTVNGKATVKNWAAYRARFVERERIAAGVAFWRANANLVAARRRALGRAGAGHRRRHRRRDLLRPPDRHLPRHRRAGDAALSISPAAAATARRSSAASSNSSCSGARASAATRRRCKARSPARWACRSSCRAASTAGRWTSTVTAMSTWPAARADAIGSVARYLNYFGWERGLPTHFDVRAPDDETNRALLLGPDILPLFSAEEFTERGATLDRRGPQPRRPAGAGRAAQRRCVQRRATSPARATSGR